MYLNRRVRWFVSVPIIAATTMITVAARWPAEIPLCQTAQKWVGEHRTNLPSTLPQLAMYSGPFRIAIFNALPLSVQKRLWHDQLETFISTPELRASWQRAIIENSAATELSEHQQAIIRTELTRLDVYFDSSLSIEDRKEAVHASIPRIRGAFSSGTARAIFTTLGPMEPSVARSRTRTLSAHEASLGVALSAAARAQPCLCNNPDDVCCPPPGWNGPCLGSGTGCGFYGADPCNSEWAACVPVKRPPSLSGVFHFASIH